MILKLKNTIVPVVKQITNIHFWIHLLKNLYLFTGFFVLLILFMLKQIDRFLISIPIFGKIYQKIPGRSIWISVESAAYTAIEKIRTSEVKRTYLISLAYKNLMVKKTRSFITILGMSVGIGIIVFLLSLGYGIERLVISQVAGLDELRIIDVTASDNTALRLNKAVYDKVSKLPQVQKAAPLISVVGKISYNRATTDMLAYAVPKNYLDIIKVKLLNGKIFSDDKTFERLSTLGSNESVAGVFSKLQEVPVRNDSQKVTFSVLPSKTVSVWESCTISSRLLGYTTRIEGMYTGEEMWGGEYAPFSIGRAGYDRNRGVYLGKWVKGKVPLYEKTVNEDLRPVLDEQARHLWAIGCMKKPDVVVTEALRFAEVMGESTSSAQTETPSPSASDSAGLGYDPIVVSSSSSGIEMVVLQASGSGQKQTQKLLAFGKKPAGQAVVSSGFISLLGISSKKAIGTKFKSSFVLSKNLLPDVEGRALSEEVEYIIIGVVDDPDNTYFYIPFTDMRNLGVGNYSQMKVVLAKNEDISKVRKSIETLGFRTNSTIDTVKQIEALFINLRLVLGILGLVALGVASLGMFNTLTVSLLERTREIGGMKTMGMVSEEVQDLFLAEAMIMGLAGGIGGLFLGAASGKILSLLVSVFAFANGQGYLDLTYLPPSFVIFILISSFFVGVLTGIYPAERAKKISALNALRYE